MRAGFGLVSLLLGVFLMLWLYAGPGSLGGGSLGTAARVQKQVTPQVNIISGRSADGSEVASSTIRLSNESTTGRPRIVVEAVKPLGAMHIRFGFQPGDRLKLIGPLEVGTMVTSAGEASDFLMHAYSREQTVTVERAGRTIELPTAEHRQQLAALLAAAEQQQAQQAAQQAAQQTAVAATQPAASDGGWFESLRKVPGSQ
jgi:hypothetical protein